MTRTRLPLALVVPLMLLTLLTAWPLPAARAEPPAVSTSAEGFKSEIVVDGSTAADGFIRDRRFRNFAICDLTLEQAVDLIRRETGLNIVVETWRIEEAGVDLKRKTRLYLEDVRFDHAFDVLLAAYGRDAGLKLGERRENILVISTRDGVTGTVTQMYDVRMLIEVIQAGGRGRPLGPRLTEADEDDVVTREEVVEQITKLLQETIDPDSWRDNGGSDGGVRAMAGRLFVTHTPAVQKDVAKFLNDLEQELRKPMPPPAVKTATTQPTEKE